MSKEQKPAHNEHGAHRENVRALGPRRYIVWTQAGFKQAIRSLQLAEEGCDPIEGFPTKYPSVVSFVQGYRGYHYWEACCTPLHKAIENARRSLQALVIADAEHRDEADVEAGKEPQIFAANEVVAAQWGVDPMTPFVRLMDKATWDAMCEAYKSQPADDVADDTAMLNYLEQCIPENVLRFGPRWYWREGHGQPLRRAESLRDAIRSVMQWKAKA